MSGSSSNRPWQGIQNTFLNPLGAVAGIFIADYFGRSGNFTELAVGGGIVVAQGIWQATKNTKFHAAFVEGAQWVTKPENRKKIGIMAAKTAVAIIPPVLIALGVHQLHLAPNSEKDMSYAAVPGIFAFVATVPLALSEYPERALNYFRRRGPQPPNDPK